MPVTAHGKLAMRITKWSVLLIGLATSLLLLCLAAYNFFIVRGFSDSYANLGLLRGYALSCVALAICLVAIAAFRQLPRFPRGDRSALLLLIVGAAFALGPFVYGYTAKELCLGSHRTWNVTQVKCEQ